MGKLSKVVIGACFLLLIMVNVLSLNGYISVSDSDRCRINCNVNYQNVMFNVFSYLFTIWLNWKFSINCSNLIICGKWYFRMAYSRRLRVFSRGMLNLSTGLQTWLYLPKNWCWPTIGHWLPLMWSVSLTFANNLICFICLVR